MLQLILSAAKNPDFKNQPKMPKKEVVTVAAHQAASRTCRQWIENHKLGGGNWTGGQILRDGHQVARVSFNGRVWDNSDNEISLA